MILAASWHTLFADFAFFGGFALGCCIAGPLIYLLVRRHLRKALLREELRKEKRASLDLA